MNVPELVKEKIWKNKKYALIAGILSISPIFGFVIIQQFGLYENLTEFINTGYDSNSNLTREINSDRLFGNNDVAGIFSETKNILEDFLIHPTYNTIMKFQ